MKRLIALFLTLLLLLPSLVSCMNLGTSSTTTAATTTTPPTTTTTQSSTTSSSTVPPAGTSSSSSTTTSSQQTPPPVTPPAEYTVTFVANGQTVAIRTYTEDNKQIDVPAVPTRDHYENGVWEAYTLDGTNKTVNAVYTPKQYTVTFVADGQVVATRTYTVENKQIDVPAVPAKDHYENGAWESYTLDGGNKTVNAVYDAVSYTVTFVANGQTVAIRTYTMENKQIDAPAVPARDHYENGVWESYVLDGTNKTVNAVYTPKQYTVTFVADGQVVATRTYTVENKQIDVPAVPAKDHYENGAWESYTLDGGNKTVNAVYDAVSYTVTFVANGQTVAIRTYTVENNTVTAPAVPAKEHYENGVWEAYTLDGGNKTVNATYTAKQYTVKFMANGTLVSTQTYTVENKNITVPAVPKNAYGADGVWGSYLLNGGDKVVNAIYDETEYKIFFFVDGQLIGEVGYHIGDTEIVAPAVPTRDHYNGVWGAYTLDGGNKTVTASYTPKQYSVTFMAHGETIASQTYTVENKNISAPAVPAPKAHYENGAWESYTLDGGDKVVHAVYTAIEYTVTFMANGQTVATRTYTIENKNITAPAVPAKEHYENGVWSAYTLDGGNKTVTASYTAKQYTVTFMNGSTVVSTQTYTVENKNISAPDVPQKPHYTGAWESYTLNGGDKTVSVLYTAKQYTVTFMNGSTVVSTQTYTVENKNISTPDVPQKEHYTSAWESYTLDGGDKTVSVLYTAITYTVTFLADGNTVSVQSYTVDSKNILVPAVPQKAHYENGTWSAYTLDGGNKTVTASYTPKQYTVTFLLGGEVVSTQTYTVESNTVTVPSIPQKEHYNGAWESYTLDGGNKTVNAIYTAIAYTVTFVADGQVVATRTYTVENKQIDEPTFPQKDYYNGAWESYTLDSGNKEVHAVYTLKPADSTANTLAKKLLNDGFVFIRPNAPSDMVKDAYEQVVAFSRSISRFGTTVKDDLASRKAGAKEVQMGKVRRTETTDAYNALYDNRQNAEMDWRITMTADTVIIIGGSDHAVVTALAHFLQMLKADARAFEFPYDSGIQEYDWVTHLGNQPIQNYKIVIPQNADAVIQTAARTLQQNILITAGYTLPIVDDTTAQSAYELVIGKTSRPVSASARNALRAGRQNCVYDGIVYAGGNHIAILGGASDSTALAVDYFSTDYLVQANQAQLVGISRLYQKDGMQSISLGTNDMGDYRIVYAEGAPFDLRYVAYKMQKLLYEQFGYDLQIVTDATPAVAGQKEFLLGKTNRPSSTTLAVDRYAAKIDQSGNVVFDAGHYVGVQKMYATMLAELSRQSGKTAVASVSYTGTVTDIALTWAPDLDKKMTDLKGNALNNKTILKGFDTTDQYTLVWNDEFDGTALDYEKWSGATPMNFPDMRQHMEDPYVTVKDGNLVLYADYTRTGSGRYDVSFDTAYSIVTNDTMNYSGGYVEMRARIPFSEGGKGEWPSFWAQSATSVIYQKTYREEHNGNLYDSGYFVEVDMFEQFSKNDQGWGLYCVCSNLHKWFNDGYSVSNTDSTVARASTMAYAPQEGVGPSRYKFNSASHGNEYHSYGFLWTDEFMAFAVDGQFYYAYSMIESGHDWVNRVWNTKTEQWEELSMDGFQKENMALNVIIGHMFFTPGGAKGGTWYSDYYKEGATTWEGNQTSDWCEINWGREDECFPSYYIVDYMRVYQCADDRIYTPDEIGLGTPHVQSDRWK